ncbi:MAG: extracellular solute-binding protein, partial [Thaumarchaeota archaeon]|nr:extracellular solute-binding protein [Nitrososphaerota archaeon]
GGLIPGVTEDGFWTLQSSGISSGISYNTEQVSQEEVPKTWDDLVDPKWKGKIMTVNSVTTNYWLWNTQGKEWFEKMALNEPQINPSFPGTVQGIAQGIKSLGYGLTQGITAFQARRGGPIAYQIIEPVWGGDAYWAIQKDSKHPNAARVTMDFLLGFELVDYTVKNRFSIPGRNDVIYPWSKVGMTGNEAFVNDLFPDLARKYGTDSPAVQKQVNEILGVG